MSVKPDSRGGLKRGPVTRSAGRGRLILAAAVGAVALVATTVLSAAAQTSHQAGSLSRLAGLRQATGRFHDIAAAEQHGYALLTDAAGVACIAMPGMGAMGVHWANSSLVGDPSVLPRHPEALVYAPSANGTLHLAAVEYVTIKSAWDATHTQRPSLFGHPFNFTDAPNRFGLPPFYSLHVWAWKANPAGTFAMWNPGVTCSTA